MFERATKLSGEPLSAGMKVRLPSVVDTNGDQQIKRKSELRPIMSSTLENSVANAEPSQGVAAGDVPSIFARF